MKSVYTLFIPLFLVLHAQAQNDPFAVNTSTDAAALSPRELPTFKEYKSDPENIQVKTISIEEAHNIISASREPVMILDARTKEEYTISRIARAKRCGYHDFSIEKVWMVRRESPVIIYSATSANAKIVAQYLKLVGFRDVKLLEGGLIAWKNKSKEVVDSSQNKTEKVHVGAKNNIKLLKKGKGTSF